MTTAESQMTYVAHFAFSGSELHLETGGAFLSPAFDLDWSFQRRVKGSSLVLAPLQAPTGGDPPLALSSNVATSSDLTIASGWILGGEVQLGSYRYASNLVADINLDAATLFDTFETLTTGSGPTAVKTRADNFGAEYAITPALFNELRRPFSLYNWEIGFHAPMAIAGKLASARQWDDAFKVFHAVFDPGSTDTDPQRVWKFPPFKLTSPEAGVEAKFLALKPGTYDKRVTSPAGARIRSSRTSSHEAGPSPSEPGRSFNTSRC